MKYNSPKSFRPAVGSPSRRDRSWLLIISLILSLSFILPANAVVNAKTEVKCLPFYQEEDFLAERARTIAELTPEEKERDYEAFWEIIENGYPFAGLLQDGDVDFHALKDAYQNRVYEIYDKASWESFFAEIVDQLLGDYGDLGHLSIMSQSSRLLNSDFQSYCYYLAEYPDDPWLEMYQDVFANPHVHGFYNLEEEEREPGGPPPFLDMPDNLHYEYNAAADYAYIKIDSFLNQNPEDVDILQNFFMEAEEEGIKNVIIDIRGNGGGYNDYWLMNIVAPNIQKPLEVTNYGLYHASEWTKPYIDYWGGGNTYEEELEAYGSEDEYPTLIFSWHESEDDKLPEMPELDKQAVKDLTQVFEEHIRIAPSFEEPLFSGNFWLLSNGQSYSASEYFISFAKRTAFARVVGEESAGDGSCVITLYNALPESGLLIRYNAIYGLNSDGSNSELFASKPDYEIVPGEDAFYKTLELIAAEK
ncbi:MAG: S41 family peptidase [Eubacteriales bacterium]|nr:S41 family peptidase [Eubacteriales bacterium]